MVKKKVLVTGANGYIASQILPALRERYDLTLLDIKRERADGTLVEGIIVADLTITDVSAYRAYFRGIDTVVHLAYYRDERTPGYAKRSYYDERVNVDMAYRVYQLSLEEEVRRVVVASSNHAADWYEALIHRGKFDVVGPWTNPKSDNFYGWAKIAYEALGFVYACGTLGRKLEVVQIRIGAPREIMFKDCGSVEKFKRDLGAYVSPGDLRQLFVNSIEASTIEDEYGIPFQVFYGVSNNTRAFWSIANARKVIRYEPVDDSELKYADEISKYVKKGGRTLG